MWRVVPVAAVFLASCAHPSPPNVSVSLYQTRSDTPLDMIEIQVHNGGSEQITVDRAELRSQRLDTAAVWDRPVRVPAGYAVDLKVRLPEPVCGAAAGEQVSLSIDGRHVRMPAGDPLGQLGQYVQDRCFEQDASGSSNLEVRGVGRRGLRVLVGSGAARIGAVGSTTLFRPLDPQALAAPPGRASAVRGLDLTANRCDAHALGEDKQGTYFPVEVTLADGRTGTVTLGVTDAQRADLYRLYARMCGLS